MKKNKISIALLLMLIVSVQYACIDNQFSNTAINLASGYQLYEKNCSNCHQEDGSGLAKLYPPLLEADYIKNHPLIVDSIIRHGQSGPITVNGVQYNMAMPANKKLSDFEVKQISSYVLIKFNKLDSMLLKE